VDGGGGDVIVAAAMVSRLVHMPRVKTTNIRDGFIWQNRVQ
jgi:hypothetical protein